MAQLEIILKELQVAKDKLPVQRTVLEWLAGYCCVVDKGGGLINKLIALFAKEADEKATSQRGVEILKELADKLPKGKLNQYGLLEINILLFIRDLKKIAHDDAQLKNCFDQFKNAIIQLASSKTISVQKLFLDELIHQKQLLPIAAGPAAADAKGVAVEATDEKAISAISDLELMAKKIAKLEQFYDALTAKELGMEKVTQFLAAAHKINELDECNCDTFFRSKTLARQNIENYILNLLKHIHGETKPILTCLSLGSGKLLQDFVIFAKLLLAGYSLDIILVEKKQDNDFKNALQIFKFLRFIAKANGLDFSVACFTDIRSFVHAHPEKQIDVAYAVDFDNFYFETEPLVLVYRQLKNYGFFCLTMSPAPKKPASIYLFTKGDPEGMTVNGNERLGILLDPSAILAMPLKYLPTFACFNAQEGDIYDRGYERARCTAISSSITCCLIKPRDYGSTPFLPNINLTRSCFSPILSYVGFFEMCGRLKDQKAQAEMEKLEKRQLEELRKPPSHAAPLRLL